MVQVVWIPAPGRVSDALRILPFRCFFAERGVSGCFLPWIYCLPKTSLRLGLKKQKDVFKKMLLFLVNLFRAVLRDEQRVATWMTIFHVFHDGPQRVATWM